MIKSRRKIFKESLSSVRNEIRDMFEDIKDGLESARNDGVGVLDVNVVVQTWDQGAPVLVKGAYNYYSGDINVDGNEFIDDFDSLFGEYMKKFDDEVKERNDMLDDILNKMWDDVENGDLDEEEYQEEQMRLMDDTCTWSISIDLNRTGGGLLSSMAVSIESGDADVLDRDTRSVDEVERWCKKKSESRIARIKNRKFEKVRDRESLLQAIEKAGGEIKLPPKAQISVRNVNKDYELSDIVSIRSNGEDALFVTREGDELMLSDLNRSDLNVVKYTLYPVIDRMIHESRISRRRRLRRVIESRCNCR